MKKKQTILATLTLSLYFTMTACGNSPDNTETTVATIETSDISDEYIVYPIAIESKLYDYATTIPNIVYTTPASENGLSGNAYCVSGTVIEVTSLEESELGCSYFIVENEIGKVYFVDFTDIVPVEDDDDKEVIKALYGSGYDSTFPKVNEKVTVYGLYDGYSDVYDSPVFFFGLNKNVQKIMLSETETEIETEMIVNQSDEIETLKTEDSTEAITETTDTEQYTELENTSESPSIDVTIGMENALSRALKYLRYSPFSYSGLIKQLEYEGYSTEEATYAVDNCGADWNEQAAQKAQRYLEYSSFSKSRLISQLEYEGFTKSQAEYGAAAVGY